MCSMARLKIKYMKSYEYDEEGLRTSKTVNGEKLFSFGITMKLSWN